MFENSHAGHDATERWVTCVIARDDGCHWKTYRNTGILIGMNVLLSTDNRGELRDRDGSAATETGLLRGVALVWMAYTLTLALIDILLLPDVMPTPAFYLAHLLGAGALLVLVSLAGRRFRSYDALPLCIGWIVAMTILAALPSAAWHASVRRRGPGAAWPAGPYACAGACGVALRLAADGWV